MHSNTLVPLIIFGSLVWLFWLRTICTYFMIHSFSFIQQPLFNVQPSILNIQQTESPGRAACLGSREEQG